ncbi:MAG: hypothetical protein K6T56_00205 [Burkholderiales bacterium]|jgi:heme O synthase-like polyprenyltransferase|nr:hypothetical protein [Burkholderiales bacterium]
MPLLRLYLILAGLAVAGALLLGLLLRDRRWFRFAWQVFKFSLVLLILVLGAAALTRVFLR